MIVAVLADTHLPRGPRALPDECVRRLREADAIVHAGDHCSLASLEELRALGPPVHAVHGNADEPALRALLPRELVVELGGARLAVVHDAGPRVGREERLAARFPGCHAVIYGHTHVPQAEHLRGVWILNPGSPTERRRSPSRALLILRTHGDAIEPEPVLLP